MKKVLVICGPTASGKSSFAVQAAKAFDGEIISGDSIQVYRGMKIGSGLIAEEEMQGIPHHLLQFLSPKQPYSAYDFQQNARREIDACAHLPILCGGTGLYLKSCLYDYDFVKEDSMPADMSEYEAMDDETLYRILQEKDPAQSLKVHPNNRRRVLRSLQILRETGKPQSELEKEQKHEMIYDAFLAGCTMDRDKLYASINHRTEGMFQQGLEEEVEGLLEEGIVFEDPGMQGIGYREWKPYFDGICTRDEVLEEIQKHTRQFAKRQYTWLNHQMPVHWFRTDSEEEKQNMMKEIQKWLKQN